MPARYGDVCFTRRSTARRSSAQSKVLPSTANVQRYHCENGDASVKNKVYIVSYIHDEDLAAIWDRAGAA
jgi:hypothetical protein